MASMADSRLAAGGGRRRGAGARRRCSRSRSSRRRRSNRSMPARWRSRQDGKPELSRFQARDGTWLAYRLYPAADGGRDHLAIVYHGSSASSDEMNATALALAKAGFVGGRGRHARPRRLGFARRHRLCRPARGRSRRSRRPSARRLPDRAADAGRPFLGRRLRLARRRRAGRRVVRPLCAARALSRLSRADQSPGGGTGAVGGARHSAHHRADGARRGSELIGRSRCRRSPSPTARGGDGDDLALFLPPADQLRPAAGLGGRAAARRRARSN